LSICVIEALIFIHWAIIIQIIVGSISGRIMHDRTRSCQNSNLYIIYDIVPDINIVVLISTFSFDIVITKTSISTFFFDIDVKKRRYRARQSQNDPPCHPISKSISTSCVDIDVKKRRYRVQRSKTTLLATRYRRFCVDIGIDIDAQKFVFGHWFYFLQISTKMPRISNVLNSYTDIGYVYVLPTLGTIMLPTSRTISCLPAGRAGQVPQSSILTLATPQSSIPTEQHTDNRHGLAIF
jgi:hypothetical protein